MHLGNTLSPANCPIPSSKLRSLIWLRRSLPMSLSAKKDKKNCKEGICLDPGSRARSTASGSRSFSIRGANRKMPPTSHVTFRPSKMSWRRIRASVGTLVPLTVSPIASFALRGTGGKPAALSNRLIVRGLTTNEHYIWRENWINTLFLRWNLFIDMHTRAKNSFQSTMPRKSLLKRRKRQVLKDDIAPHREGVHFR